MSLDEALFGWMHRKVTRWRARESDEVAARAVDTHAHLARLRVLAGAAAGRDVEVSIVDGEGGFTRDAVLLPARVTALASREANESLLVVRATLAGALVRAALDPGRDADATLRAALPAIEAALAEEMPGWAARRRELGAELPLALLCGRLHASPAKPANAAAARTAGELERDVTTEREGRRRAPPSKTRRLQEDDRPDNPFVHSFEKVHTAEEHKGGDKKADGSDALDDQLDALNELDLDEVVLSRERTRSVYKADAVFAGQSDAATAAEHGALAYDEWDAARHRYLARHCALTVEPAPPSPIAGAALRARIQTSERRAVVDTRAELLRLDAALRWHTRQPDGPDVDLDALVDRTASLRSGHEGPTRLYVSRRRRGHSLALMLLVDASLSTDAWVNDRRVLDVERDAAAILALALEGLSIEVAMAAFCSFSREDCRFVPLKSFDEDLSVGLGRLAALEPRGYTRVGPALRHATRALEHTTARRRAILLLSDGKPTDTDRYEGRHGIGDVRQAVREAKQREVDVFTLAADPRSKALLPLMFGTHGHAGLAGPDDVARAASLVVTQLAR